MAADDLVTASLGYIELFMPVILIIAAISLADLIIDFAIKLFKKAPDFGFNSRRSRR